MAVTLNHVMKKKQRRYLERFKMRCWWNFKRLIDREDHERWSLKKSRWRKNYLLDTVMMRKGNWLGYISRINRLLLNATEEKIEDTRSLERRKIKLSDDLKKIRCYWHSNEGIFLWYKLLHNIVIYFAALLFMV